MHSTLRTVCTVVGFAAVTAAATLTVFWPKATLADDEDELTAALALDGIAVADKVIVTGELVRDPKAKTGWVVAMKAENRGTGPESCDLETDIDKTVSNPMSRAMPMPTVLWKTKETIVLAAGEKVEKRYTVPANVAAQLTANATAQARAAATKPKGPQMQMPQSATYFQVRFQKAHAARG